MAEKKQVPYRPHPQINGRFPQPPFWLVATFGAGICVTWLGLAQALRARTTRSPDPRIHLVQDMDNQPKYKAQHGSTVFADGRASRPRIEGTVAFGKLDADEGFHHGYNRTWNEADKTWNVTYVSDFPKQLTFDQAFLKRGQVKFNTYCMPCHGYDGQGNGPINQDASALQSGKGDVSKGMAWVNPSNLTDGERQARPDGHIFNTVTIGIRNMGGYGSQIPDVTDRWAVVAYVRSLQLSHRNTPQPQQARAGETSDKTLVSSANPQAGGDVR